MALLSEVIKEFQNNFRYLNSNQQRQSRWYEFWFLNQCKKRLTNTALTYKLEEAARNCLKSLNQLASEGGHAPFADYQDQFFLIISQTFHSVQVQRFTHGTVQTSHYNTDHQFILERSIVAKDPGFFENEIVNALQAISSTYPEHQHSLNELINKIKASTLRPYVFFQESAKVDLNGKFYYSEKRGNQLKNNLYNLKEREEFAEAYINTLVNN
ncbi:hypothetical protein ACQUW5_01415 [Legionella sp. CNM-1927-20]|uniref:hypothetical protein n=1 Tax=Legionella sp. CNM-1927-20 TaxID=3422221 RepID=UPI00403B1BC2